ncbi:MAG: ATPase, T2SS/T4P/T4SS family [Candidatus Micrarchaeaceae archaeon]
MMDEETFLNFEDEVLNTLSTKLSGFQTDFDIKNIISKTARIIDPEITDDDLDKLTKDINDFYPIQKYINNDDVEDVMVNNTLDIFIYHAEKGAIKVPEVIEDKRKLERLVKKFKMYATVISANKSIYDVHLPNKSRVNIVESPLGADITIRNFKEKALSILDLINLGELSYNIAGRFWLYAEGMKIRPANLLFGGMPASGKTTLLNSMFSFFRPEQRIITIEDTYELNTETQENCVRLETSTEVSLEELVQNSLRMRPDMLIVGEVRGKETKDMMTAMNIGKITMSTIHASTARDIITRLEHTPMNIEKDIIPLIDALVLVSQININGKFSRKITQISEISGIETQVLLSDLYKYDYKTKKGSDILPSVTYRDTLANLSGIPPSEIVREEKRRAMILESMNKKGIRGLKQINEMCKEYYDNPNRVLTKLEIKDSV